MKQSNVYYAKGLTHNLISYGILDKKGYSLTRRGGQRVLTSIDGKDVAFDVDLMKNVLVVKAKVRRNVTQIREVIMAVVGGYCAESDDILCAV